MNSQQIRPADPGKARTVAVGEDADGQRIDNFLRQFLPGVPKSRLYRLVRTGQVRVNGGRIKAMHRLQQGDQVRIPPVRLSSEGPIRPPDEFLSRVRQAIIYDDGDLLVLNKPSGMPVHSGSGVPFGVADALSHSFDNARLVHRLDRPTSGCLLAARRRATLNRLQQQFKDGGVEKHYLTLVQGQWRGSARVLEDRLARSEGHDRRVVVSPEGKTAIATFKPLAVTPQASLLEVTLETGRTHQIRVQAAHARHPVAGDQRYGDPQFNREMANRGLKRLFLHAFRVSLKTEKQGRLEIEAPLPPELAVILDSLGLSRESDKPA